MTDKPYHPVSCALYDRLTDLSVMGTGISLVIRTGQEETLLTDVRITDIVTRCKEEFLLTDQGDEIRLDRIIRIS